jgi:agmatinase
MFHKCGFADAFSDPKDADFAVIGLPFDVTASFRSGSREGPDAIRLASYNFESYDNRHFVDLADLHICDLGNMELGSDPACAWEAIGSGLDAIPKGSIPIIFGGEHSITPPIVEHMASLGGPGGSGDSADLGVLVLDAHLDLRSQYGYTTFSHACAGRRIFETKGVQGYASIGIRSGSKEEFDYAKEKGLMYFTSDDVSSRGINLVMDDVLINLDCERLYLSIDMDALDPAYAPAVGNPEPCGLTPRDVRDVIDKVAPKAVAIDINEIAPAYDRGQTAILGAWMAREFIAAKAVSLKENKR